MTMESKDYIEALRLTMENYKPQTVGEALDAIGALHSIAIAISNCVDVANLEHGNPDAEIRLAMLSKTKAELISAISALTLVTVPSDPSLPRVLFTALVPLLGLKLDTMVNCGDPAAFEAAKGFQHGALESMVGALASSPWTLGGLSGLRSDMSLEAQGAAVQSLAEEFKESMRRHVEKYSPNPELN